MSDVYGFYALLIGALGTINFVGVAATRPRAFERTEAAAALMRAQAAYERRAALREGLRLLPFVLLAYFLGRALLAPHGAIPDAVVRTMLAGALLAYALGAFGATFLRHGLERRFVAAHPTFRACLAPLGLRLSFVGVYASLASGTALSLLDDGDRALAFVLLGVLGEIACLGLFVRARSKAVRRFDPESPIARRIDEVVAQFGYEPQGVIVSPSLNANAFALPNGTVSLTSALVALASLDEIAAIVAHELSHLRTRDARRWQVRWLANGLVALALATGVAWSLSQRSATGPYVVPIALLVFLCGVSLGRTWIVPAIRRREFGCDADAAALGLGAPLARALVTIHAFRRLPNRWTGLDSWLSTHPSLEDRLTALAP